MVMNAGFAMNPTPDNPHPMSAPETTQGERNIALACHLLMLAGTILPVVPSLILWLVKKHESAFIDDHGKETVNFQISLIVYLLIGAVLTPACGIGLVIIGVVYVIALVTMILAAIAANQGRFYRYPMCFRIIP